MKLLPTGLFRFKTMVVSFVFNCLIIAINECWAEVAVGPRSCMSEFAHDWQSSHGIL